MFGKILKSFVYAINGLKTVWKEERNFRLEAAAALLVAVLAYYFNFSYIESALVILAIILVLGAEIINTAVEDLCNKIEPNEDSAIGKIKDTMAAFTLVFALGAVILAVFAVLLHFA